MRRAKLMKQGFDQFFKVDESRTGGLYIFETRVDESLTSLIGEHLLATWGLVIP